MPSVREAGDPCHVLPLLLGLLTTERVCRAGSSGPVSGSCCCCSSACRAAQACSPWSRSSAVQGGSQGAKTWCWQSRGHPWWPSGRTLELLAKSAACRGGTETPCCRPSGGLVPCPQGALHGPCPAQCSPGPGPSSQNPQGQASHLQGCVCTLDPPGAWGQVAGHRGRAPSPRWGHLRKPQGVRMGTFWGSVCAHHKVICLVFS